MPNKCVKMFIDEPFDNFKVSCILVKLPKFIHFVNDNDLSSYTKFLDKT